ncbi:MAG: hypothetical protein OEU46_06885 [Alphaproteobacteria bacterium]|nr:hypothetical protein [Alphaproteobacteria bacterium]
MRARKSLIVAASALGIVLGIGGLSTPAAADSYRVLAGFNGYHVFHRPYYGHRARGHYQRRHFRRHHRGWGGYHRGWSRRAHRVRRHSGHHWYTRGIGRHSDRAVVRQNRSPRQGRNRGHR